MIRLIAFDLDGTIIDSRRDLADSANLLLAEHGAAPLPLETVLACVGEGARLLVTRLLTAAGVSAPIDPAVARFLEIYDGRRVVHTQLYPGMAETLAALAPLCHLAVLTNKPREPAIAILGHFGLLDLFLDVIGGDGPMPRKPDPAGLHALRAQAQARPEETLLFGDSWVDVETARQAGAHAAFATYGFGAPPPDGFRPGEAQIAEPNELPDVVARLYGLPQPQAVPQPVGGL